MLLFPAGRTSRACGLVLANAVAGEAHASGAKAVEHAGHIVFTAL